MIVNHRLGKPRSRQTPIDWTLGGTVVRYVGQPTMTEDPRLARILVTIATYNEKENLPRLLEAILQELPAANVLVIDDNSPDGTGELADEFTKQDPRVQVLHRKGKLGLGTATIAGMQYGVEQGFDFIINMDADFSHHPRHLPALLAGMEQHDVMIGSRYVPGGGVVGWNWTRKIMSWGINVYSRFTLGLTARDTSGAFRCYRGAKLKLVDFEQVYSKGYSFQEEFLYHCQRAGCRIGETPITFEDRKVGQSKISLKEIVMALWALFYVGIRRR